MASDAVESRFKVGDVVRIRAMFSPGHTRTPWYVRGQAGTIERVCGIFGNPEELAYARAGTPRQPLYRVRFSLCELWADYHGPAQDTIEIEIYQHWLEPISEKVTT
jgi:nitrile hydratase subunit beta